MQFDGWANQKNLIFNLVEIKMLLNAIKCYRIKCYFQDLVEENHLIAFNRVAPIYIPSVDLLAIRSLLVQILPNSKKFACGGLKL